MHGCNDVTLQVQVNGTSLPPQAMAHAFCSPEHNIEQEAGTAVELAIAHQGRFSEDLYAVRPLIDGEPVVPFGFFLPAGREVVPLGQFAPDVQVPSTGRVTLRLEIYRLDTRTRVRPRPGQPLREKEFERLPGQERTPVYHFMAQPVQEPQVQAPVQRSGRGEIGFSSWNR